MPQFRAPPAVTQPLAAAPPEPTPSRREFLLGTAATALAAPPLLRVGPAHAASRSTTIQQATLDNGLQIVVAPDYRLPIVTHTLWYKVGAGDEVLGQTGIAHFFEHLMFKGTASFPAATFKQYVSRFGGSQNAFTSMDNTYYMQRLPKQHLPQLMAMEADRMTHLDLTQEQIATELSAVLEEKRGRETSDNTLYGQGIAATQYPGHRLGVPVIGLEADLRAMSRDTLLAFYRRYYAPNNAILVVGGDVTLDDVVEQAKRSYGAVPPSTTLPERVRPALPAKPASDRYVFRSSQAGTVSMTRYFPLPASSAVPAADKMALSTLAHLSQGLVFEHGAYRRLVMDQKVASGAWGGYSHGLSTGDLSFGMTAVQDVAADAAERALDDVIGVIRAKLPDDTVLAELTSKRVANDIRYDDNNYSVVTGIGATLTGGSPLEDFLDYRARLAKVTLADVRRAIDTYLAPNNSLLAVMTPKA